MEYPVQTERRKVLEYLYRKLIEAHAKGHTVFPLKATSNKVVTYGWKPKEVIHERRGLSVSELASIIRALLDEGYITAHLAVGPFGGEKYSIRHLTDLGLREIGELPDPHAELMQRLDLAILQIKQDQRLSEPQKQQTINWLEEGKIVARTLTIDAIKVILAGAIL
jgi:hypothetical protein